MNVYLTVEIKETDPVFAKLSNVEIFSMDVFLTERELSPHYDKEKIFSLFSIELCTKQNDILFRYNHSIDEIIKLSNKLQENNQRLHTVFIPSSERLLKGKEKEVEFTRKHANFASFSPSQIEEGYQEWRKIYDEIKQELPKHSIEVKEV